MKRPIEKVLQRAQQRNLNKEKSQIGLREIHFLGHVLSHEGIKPDPKKVHAITDMDRPKSKDDVHRFIGMATYLSKFIPNYSEVSSPLRVLLEQETEWHWTEHQENAFQRLKHLITNVRRWLR